MMTQLRIRLYACFVPSHSIDSHDVEPMGENFHYHTAPLAEALDWYIRMQTTRHVIVKDQEKA